MQEIGQAGAVLLVLMILLFGFITMSASGHSLFPVLDNVGTRILRINDLKIQAEEARTKEEHKIGLTGRNRLKRRNAMLFYFDEAAKWRVSTKGMRFPIDIFWIDNNRKIVDMKRYANEDSEHIFSPKYDIVYILETNADFANIHNINIGDYVIGI